MVEAGSQRDKDHVGAERTEEHSPLDLKEKESGRYLWVWKPVDRLGEVKHDLGDLHQKVYD